MPCDDITRETHAVLAECPDYTRWCDSPLGDCPDPEWVRTGNDGGGGDDDDNDPTIVAEDLCTGEWVRGIAGDDKWVDRQPVYLDGTIIGWLYTTKDSEVMKAVYITGGRGNGEAVVLGDNYPDEDPCYEAIAAKYSEEFVGYA